MLRETSGFSAYGILGVHSALSERTARIPTIPVRLQVRLKDIAKSAPLLLSSVVLCINKVGFSERTLEHRVE